MKSIPKRVASVFAFLVFSVASLAAHDMWLEPTAFFPAAGKIVGLKLRVGQDFLGDPIPYSSSLIEQFISMDGAGRKPVVGREGADPGGLLRIAEPGLTVVGYKSNPSPVSLAAAKFNQYLKEEGLETVAEWRASHKQSESDVKELFTRCAKALIFSAAEPRATGSDRALGFTLELVAQKNPYTLNAGANLPVSLFYEGRPLAGALVVAMNKQNPAAKLTARTDNNGRVTFQLPEGGIWLIKAVHMVAAPAGANADWASFWASLTFELPPPATGAVR
jgi:uncharacterized GH25 family protein